MKKIIPIFACALLFISCHQNKEGIVKDFIEAENNFNTEKISQLITDSFTCYGTDTLSKEAFLARLEANKLVECQISLLNIQDLDSIVKTEEQWSTIIDVPLEIAPLIVQKKTYRFTEDNKLASITIDSTLNIDEYIKSFEEKWTPFAFWVKDNYDVEEESEIIENIKKYLSEYSKLPVSDKKQYKRYAHLQGTYVSDDCAFYKKLIFKGKRTVTIIDAIFGFPFATSYELDEDLVKIRTDLSDLLFEIKDSQTLIGEGFAEGTFIKADWWNFTTQVTLYDQQAAERLLAFVKNPIRLGGMDDAKPHPHWDRTGGAVFFYPPRLDGYKRKTPDARVEWHERRESADEAVSRLLREPAKEAKTGEKRRLTIAWNTKKEEENISRTPTRYASHLEIEEGMKQNQKNGVNSLFLVQHRPIYTSIIGLNCTSSITKMHFFDFSLENIWSCQKKAVILQAFSREPGFRDIEVSRLRKRNDIILLTNYIN